MMRMIAQAIVAGATRPRSHRAMVSAMGTRIGANGSSVLAAAAGRFISW
jgi:hypothetical protein